MDWGLIFQVIGIGLTVVGFMIAGFWRMWGLITAVRDDAQKDISSVRSEANLRAEAAIALATLAKEELHQHKVHVAEVYVSKSGLREQTEQIMSAIGGIGEQIMGMNGRIDRMLERPATRTTTGRS